MINKETISPCGLYCEVCGVYQATVNDDQKMKEKFAKAYNVKIEELACRGCRSNQVFVFCRVCKIKSCAEEKTYEGCYQCDEFPCEHIEAFPVPEGKKNILRAVPKWRELGTEKWTEYEKKLFSCQDCGNQLFRGARKCRECGSFQE